MRTARTAVTVALGVVLACSAQAAGPRDVAALLRAIREKHDLPAMAGAVVAAGEVEAVGVVGVRERGRPDPVTCDDLWHLGSCTKAMTATLCAALVEEKKLAFSTTIGDAFAKDVPKMDPGWRDVTLEQLLTHHGGVPGDLAADGLWARLWARKGTPVEQRRTLLEGVLAKPPASKPGTQFEYSNAGFAIAGMMAEKAGGAPWETLIRERVFDPLGMASAGFGPPGTAAKVDQPRGHHPDGRPEPPGANADNPPSIAPAGLVHCTITDWAKFVAAHVRGERKETAKLLRPETYVKLHTPSSDDSRYAMGWIVTERPWAGGRALWHNGRNTMWYCVTWLAPERDFAVLVCCNQDGDAAAKACDEAASALIQDHLAHAKAPPK